MGAFLSTATNPDNVEALRGVETFDELPAMNDSRGETFDFASLKGKVVLAANVASKCGLTTKNYQDFAKLQDEFNTDDFVILAFPCNQFLFQEPLAANKACEFAHKRGFKGVVFEKVKVNGSKTSYVFDYLKKAAGVKRIEWNFGKFLIGKDGKVRKYYSSHTRPSKFADDVRALLSEEEAT